MNRKKDNPRPSITPADLKNNPDGLTNIVVDIYKEIGDLSNRVGKLEGKLSILIYLIIAIIVGLIGLGFKP